MHPPQPSSSPQLAEHNDPARALRSLAFSLDDSPSPDEPSSYPNPGATTTATTSATTPTSSPSPPRDVSLPFDLTFLNATPPPPSLPPHSSPHPHTPPSSVHPQPPSSPPRATMRYTLSTSELAAVSPVIRTLLGDATFTRPTISVQHMLQTLVAGHRRALKAAGPTWSRRKESELERLRDELRREVARRRDREAEAERLRADFLAVSRRFATYVSLERARRAADSDLITNTTTPNSNTTAVVGNSPAATLASNPTSSSISLPGGLPCAVPSSSPSTQLPTPTSRPHIGSVSLPGTTQPWLSQQHAVASSTHHACNPHDLANIPTLDQTFVPFVDPSSSIPSSMLPHAPSTAAAAAATAHLFPCPDWTIDHSNAYPDARWPPVTSTAAARAWRGRGRDRLEF